MPVVSEKRKAGRLPLHIECAGMPTQRQRIWTALRKHQPITVLDLQDKCGKPWITEDAIATYMAELAAAGWASADERGKRNGHLFARPKWSVTRDSIEAPRTGKDGAGLGVLAMWRAMKALKEFDYVDVAGAASVPGCEVKPQTAKSYVALLARAGYFRTVRPAKPGTPARHLLIRDTGAHAPAITRRKCVFDRNLGEFTWEENAKEVADACS